MIEEAAVELPLPGARESLAQKARLVGWALLLFGVAQVAGSFIAVHRIAMAAVQASFAEWGADRIGVRWSEDRTASTKDVVTRAVHGALFGLGAALFLFAFALLTHAGELARIRPSFGAMIFGVIVPVLAAFRDELFLRGYVLRILRGSPAWASLLVCGLAAAGWKAGSATESDATLAAVIGEGFLGVAFAALWMRDRGGWLAWGAHAAWSYATEPLMRWALFDVRASETRWGGGDAGLLGGFASTCALALVAVATVMWAKPGKMAAK